LNTLKTSKDFSNVFDGGKKFITATSIFFYLKTSSGDGRLGISVSRRVGNAVQRNKIKRIVRNIFRFFSPKGFDVVVLCRRGEVFNMSTFARDFLKFWKKVY
tara:strand:- start:1393 stop:1698 length:306 start_codon:yes stop_codon:yes gene_type:complete